MMRNTQNIGHVGSAEAASGGQAEPAGVHRFFRAGIKFAVMAAAALIGALPAPRSSMAGEYGYQRLKAFSCQSEENNTSVCLSGALPVGGLLIDAAGNLYGPLSCGSMPSIPGQILCGGGGGIFELRQNLLGWPDTVIYNFCSQSNCTDGYVPNGVLITDGLGNLYGATSGGGVYEWGAVFELTPNQSHTAWTESVLYSFCPPPYGPVGQCISGTGPWGLIRDGSGNLYGTNWGGGILGWGTVFELTPPQTGFLWTESVLYNFCSQTDCADGTAPSGLTIDASGNLYGKAWGGGNSYGVVFMLQPGPNASWNYVVLHPFCSATNCTDGAEDSSVVGPLGGSGLTMDGQGNLYGITPLGGASYGGASACNGRTPPGCGVVFELTPPNTPGSPWTYTVLYSFCPESRNCTDGRIPQGSLLFACVAAPTCARKSLIGTTWAGGEHDGGTVFALTPEQNGTWTETVLYSFCSQPNCADGGAPFDITSDGFGNLYGVTYSGGNNSGPCYVNYGIDSGGCGVVFKLVALAGRTAGSSVNLPVPP